MAHQHNGLSLLFEAIEGPEALLLEGLVADCEYLVEEKDLKGNFDRDRVGEPHKHSRRVVLQLLVDEAPVTAARILRLVKRRYYDDLTFHRVAPNFVLQGGSPGANEYSGVPAFMRDELAATPHARGTLGVSTRGRDTGDGQIFINLRDNPRLDYDYTVWGRVISGLSTIDTIQEGDSILKVEIRSR